MFVSSSSAVYPYAWHGVYPPFNPAVSVGTLWNGPICHLCGQRYLGVHICTTKLVSVPIVKDARRAKPKSRQP